jgi:VanZ family protein
LANKKTPVRLFLAISWLVFLAVAMLTPGKNLPEIHYFDFQDKFIHLFCFFIQAYLWTGVGIKKEERKSARKRNWFNLIVYGISSSVLLEAAQLLIPNRSFEWMDLIVNIIGIILGFFAYLRWPTVKIILD